MAQFDDRISGSRLSELHMQEEERLIQALAPQYGYSYIDLNGVTINPEALLIVPEAEARSAMLVPFEIRQRRVSIAFRNPNNQATQATLDRLQQTYQLDLHMCSTLSLEHAWERYADRKSTQAEKRGVLDIHPEDIEAYRKKITATENVSALVQNIRTSNSARRVSETLEVIFAGAFALGASDIHIEPEAGSIRLRYRLDGVLVDIAELERAIYERLMSRLKLLSGMVLNRHQEAQDGRFTLDLTDNNIEVRSSVIPGADGESIVMRLLDPSVASFSFEKLGLNKRMTEVMQAQLKRPNGLIITTGPTGSGKTTALYAFLREVHTPEIKIITIENPVEYKIDDIVQTQVGDDYTFSSGLKAVLRQDPDVIMVGEIRDRDVAETAIHAAQTGHLVFSTLHTNSAVGSFARLIDLGVDSRMIGSSINVIIGQRLVRTLCDECKVGHQATPAEMEIIKKVLLTHPDPPPYSNPLTIFEPKGCPSCNQTGFRGRKGIFEAVLVDDAVEEAVIRDPREHIIHEAALPQGIPTMGEHGIEKVIAGETSLPELQRVVDLNSGRATPEKDPRDESSDEDFLAHVV